jgi:hypothetical protein
MSVSSRGCSSKTRVSSWLASLRTRTDPSVNPVIHTREQRETFEYVWILDRHDGCVENLRSVSVDTKHHMQRI